jgi:hypothetical protein
MAEDKFIILYPNPKRGRSRACVRFSGFREACPAQPGPKTAKAVQRLLGSTYYTPLKRGVNESRAPPRRILSRASRFRLLDTAGFTGMLSRSGCGAVQE